MVSLKILPQISVQPDWHEAVRDVTGKTLPEDKFWVSIYKRGNSSLHTSVKVKKGHSARTATLEADDDVSVQLINSRSFKIHYDKLDVDNAIIFSPRTEYVKIKGKAVTALAISPNGELYASGQGSSIFVGQVRDGETQLVLKGHVGDITTLQYFPSNQVLLSGGSDFQLKIWSALDGSNPVTLLGHISAITDTDIISRGRNVLSSSRDGKIILWHCGSGMPICNVGAYDVPVNKIVLAPLPVNVEAASADKLDEREVETADKMVLGALNDGSIRGIHLGTKQEIFSISSDDGVAATALAYDVQNEIVIAGNAQGVVKLYKLQNTSEPLLQWQRSEHGITSLVLKLDENGETSVFVSATDGSLYRTNALAQMLQKPETLALAAEYSGNELETIYDMKAIPNSQGHGLQKLACCVRDGTIKIY